MENIVLTIHLILAVALIGTVLLQRSEGGGLGMGGGGGGGVMSGRSAATALAKVTWVLAIAFLITSLSLTMIAASKQAGDSVIERMGIESGAAPDSGQSTETLIPELPDAAEVPLTPPPAE